MKIRLFVVVAMSALGTVQAHAQAPAGVMVVIPWGGGDNLEKAMPFSDFEDALGVAGSGTVTSAEGHARP